MAIATDDHVVVQYDAERSRGFLDVLRDGDVGLGRGRVARGVVVHQDHRSGAEIERALDYLARVDRRMVDRAALLALMLDQHILAVEEQDVEFLDPCCARPGRCNSRSACPRN
jgi:hypothetical protein